MLKSENVLENETHEILWDFDLQMDHLIPAKKRRTCRLVDFAIQADDRVKIKIKVKP